MKVIMSIPDEGYYEVIMSIPDEGYYEVPDEL